MVAGDALRAEAPRRRVPMEAAGIAAAAAAAFLWGTSAAIARSFFASDEPVPVETVTAGRTLVAAALMAGWAALRRRDAWRASASARASFLATGMLLGLTSYTYYRAIDSVGVAIGILLQYVAPFIVFLWTAWRSPQPMPRRSWAALGLVLLGVVLLGLPAGGSPPAGSPGGSPPAGGIAWGLLSALLFATFTLRSRSGIERAGYWPFIAHAFLGAAVAGAAVLAARQLLDPIPFPGPVTSRGMLLSAYIGLLGTVLPFSLYLLAVERIGPARAAFASTLEPVFGGVADYVLEGAVPRPLQVAGGVVVISAVILLEWRAASRR